MIRIRVPATSANLGPGFDCLGLAINRYADFVINLSDQNACFGFETSEDNLFLKAYRYACEQDQFQAHPLNVEMHSEIPMARGLGSSAALIVAGIATALIEHTKSLDRSRLIQLANALEGHPDNIVPAIVGGLCASKDCLGKVEIIRYPIHASYHFKLLVPDFTLSTEHSRKVLPSHFEREDAVFNLSQIPFLLDALNTGNMDRLRWAIADRIHQNVRMHLHPDFKIITSHLDAINLAHYLSGAGPSLMLVTNEEEVSIKHCLEGTQAQWSILDVRLDTKGIVWSHET
jgi:homoserine kinase